MLSFSDKSVHVQLFARHQAIPPVEPNAPSLEQLYNEKLQHLREIQRELADRGLAIAAWHSRSKDLRVSIFDGGVALKVGAMNPRTEIANLESAYERCRQQLHQSLNELAQLKMQLGLVK